MVHLFWLGFALAASPGPDFFLILRHTLSFGRIIGYATLLGNRLSLCVHISLAILGLSVVLQQSLTVFLFVRFLGAAYLVYLAVGICLFAHKRATLKQLLQRQSISRQRSVVAFLTIYSIPR